jgi:lipopolysaccharide export system permease protein
MKIFDKYFTKHFLFPLAYCLFLFVFLYVTADIFGNLEDILKNNVSPAILFQYYGSFIPAIFVQTLPIASLLAIVYMLSIFNKNNELTAAKACGISLKQLLLPVFIISIMLGLVNFIVNETLVPTGTVKSEKIRSEHIKSEYRAGKGLSIIEDLTFYGKKNQLVYAQEFNMENKSLTGIIIIERDSTHRLRRKILSSKAFWIGGKWIFHDCIIYRFDKTGKSAGNPLVFKEKIMDLIEAPEQLKRHEFQAGYMSYRELQNHIERLSGSNPKILNSMKTDLYFKTALPFVSVIIMFLGIPFALSTKRGGAMSGIGISLFIGLSYYGSIYIVLAMGKGGLLPPLVAAHLPNIVFLFIAFRLLKRCNL